MLVLLVLRVILVQWEIIYVFVSSILINVYVSHVILNVSMYVWHTKRMSSFNSIVNIKSLNRVIRMNSLSGFQETTEKKERLHVDTIHVWCNSTQMHDNNNDKQWIGFNEWRRRKKNRAMLNRKGKKAAPVALPTTFLITCLINDHKRTPTTTTSTAS